MISCSHSSPFPRHLGVYARISATSPKHSSPTARLRSLYTIARPSPTAQTNRQPSVLPRCYPASIDATPSKISASAPSALRPFHTTLITLNSGRSTASRTSVSPFKLHDIGEGITEVEVLRWYVTEGQEVAEFDALCEVQSDKSVVELTSHATGKVKGIKFDAGKMVKVGQVLCEIHTESEGDEHEGTAERSSSSLSTSEKSDTTPAEVKEAEMPDQGRTESINGKEAVQQIQSEAISQAEELSESLEKDQEHTASQNPPRQGSRRHPLADKDDENQDHESHYSLFNAPDESADLAGPTRLAGEASILPNPPSSGLRSQQAPQQVERRRERTSGDLEGNEHTMKTIIKASPAVRTLAARLGVDLAEVKATGPSGRITKEDIESVAPRSKSAGNWNTSTASSTVVRDVKRDAEPESTRIEFGRTRKVMYRALGGQGSIPHFGYSHTLNLTPLLPYLKASNADTGTARQSAKSKTNYIASDIPHELVRDPLASISAHQGGSKTTILTFLVKALVLALEEHPIMRSRVRETSQSNDNGGGERWLEVNRDPVVGVAVSDPKHGLLTPSLPPLSPSTSLSTITSLLHSLRHAPNRPSAPANMTISSVGGLGEARDAMPVLPPGGGLAICAVGRAAWEMEWVARDGLRSMRGSEGRGKNVWELDEGTVEKSGVRAVLRAPVGWSGDHRVLEGAELIAFTETWKKYIEEPWRWLKVEG
ncbi:hypothetical protein IAT40_001302 [Kwoniella sp. CBS 6097]